MRPLTADPDGTHARVANYRGSHITGAVFFPETLVFAPSSPFHNNLYPPSQALRRIEEEEEEDLPVMARYISDASECQSKFTSGTSGASGANSPLGILRPPPPARTAPCLSRRAGASSPLAPPSPLPPPPASTAPCLSRRMRPAWTYRSPST